MQTLVLASGNPGKRREFRELLADCGFDVRAQSEFEVRGAEETGLTFVENALLKARHASRETGLPALADDSGIAVDALDGRPGIHSARYAGDGATDADNNAKLLDELADVPDAERGACYHCLLVLVRHAEDPTPLIAEGRWCGRIGTAPRGGGGFGYDPLFRLPGRDDTAAELSAEEKGRLSHRAIATRKLLEALA